MSSRRFTKDYHDAVIQVFKSLAAKVIKQLPSREFALCERQFTSLQLRLARWASELGAVPFALEITDAGDSEGDDLTASEILGSVRPKFVLLRLGRNLKIIGAKKIPSPPGGVPGPVEISQLSRKTVIVARAPNDAVTVYADGYTVGYFDLNHPNVQPATSSRFARRAEDYEFSILDHYGECVRFWQRTDHWASRGQRKLRARLGSRHKTELIFHFDLHHWLQTHLQAQVFSHPKNTAHDELDILVVSPTGQTFMIEVKWMGVNENGTGYTIGAVTKGLNQLRDYLAKQPTLARGTLVAYDGREKRLFEQLQCDAEHQRSGCKRLSKSGGVEVHLRGSCLVLYLESETPSQQ